MRRGRGAGLAALAAVLLVASGRAQVQQDPFLETTEGISINISCSHPSKVSGDYIHFYRQLPGQSPEFLVFTARGSKDVPGIGGKLLVSEDGRSSALWLGRPRRGDAAVYYCALGPRAEELVFGNGTQLTVEPNIPKSSIPQVIVMKSKNLQEDASPGKAACLARNFVTNSISLEMPSKEVVYEQSTPILTSEGYNAIKVVKVTRDTVVNCTAKFDNSAITKPAEEVEEPVAGASKRVCNSTEPSAPDAEGQRVNMLSMAVLGLRVLLAKSIAFNTLLSIKLFLL
ncbi:M1-specific T cell receptor alpha chain-like [Cinclus cinclus]|uniref:M1-specific T cell receptor alpha chain-like n=1 Tax=Cinclus cinclus TaxID=127875 RepID=UPI002E114C60